MIGTLPLAALVLSCLVALAWFGMNCAVYGRRALAVGDNPLATELAGTHVEGGDSSCPTYQWRRAVIDALDVLDGKEVPGPEWMLPQPAIPEDVVAEFVDERMPLLYYRAFAVARNCRATRSAVAKRSKHG